MNPAVSKILRSIDPDAARFCNESGATDRRGLSAFARGVKALGLWDSMVCWPLRKSQNAGTGTSAYSLGGLASHTGTLTNGPTWGPDGVFCDGSDDHIAFGDILPPLEAGWTFFLQWEKTDSTAVSGYPSLFGRTDGGGAANHAYQINSRNASLDLTPVMGDGVSASQSVTITQSSHTAPNFEILSAKIGGNFLSKFSDGAVISTACTLGTFHTGVVAGLFLSGGNPPPANYAMAGVIAKVLDSATISSLYTLYKSTLGDGLSLP